VDAVRNIPRTAELLDSMQELRMSNPKTEPTDNTKKDPEEWVSGDDPMTGASSFLSEDPV
jgi:hypothetical protein